MLLVRAGIVAVLLLTGLGSASAAGQEVADLQITKVASSKTVKVGGTVAYTVTVTNLGPGVATGVVWQDPLPDQLNLAEGSPEPYGTIESLPSGSSVTFTYAMTPITNMVPRHADRVAGNTALIDQSLSFDPDPSNDRGTATVRIVGPL